MYRLNLFIKKLLYDLDKHELSSEFIKDPSNIISDWDHLHNDEELQWKFTQLHAKNNNNKKTQCIYSFVTDLRGVAGLSSFMHGYA